MRERAAEAGADAPEVSGRGGAGSAGGRLSRPSTTPFIALLVPQNVQNGASGPGQRKTGLMCRKSTL